MSEVPVRVFVRVRPMLEHERLHSSDVCIRFVSHDQLVIGKDRAFRFDQVFPPDTPQGTVYEKSVSPLVVSCFEGYNVTVFAYGQTGSGKSYTVGSEHQLVSGLDQCGVIPRALEDIFQHIQGSRPDVEFSVHVSYIEIYKEELRDLIDNTVTAQEIHIREDERGHTVVVGTTEQPVSSAEEALSWLEVGNTARVTGATQMNQRSSRSHAIFTLLIEQRWKVASDSAVQGDTPASEGSGSTSVEQCLSAKFHFVDLAGSERVGRTGNQGERFKESVYINSGLLALGNVISALGDPKQKSSHVPYRASKITRLLKDSLGGNARTAMITCLSPAAINFAENLNSLKYAKRARNIRNRPVVNQDPQASKFQELQDEVQALREELLRNQASKPSTARTVMTVDTSVMATELSDTEEQMRQLEQELQLSHQRCAHYRAWLQSAVEQLAAMRDAATLDPHQLHELEEWLGRLQSLEGIADFNSFPERTTPAEMLEMSQSLVSKRALETIELLRSELERCHVDLETDEELFAEKVEELNELLTKYNLLLQEKERIEAMWLSAQETEAQLRWEIQQLLEKLSTMESRLSEVESVIQQQQRDSLEKEEEEEGESHSSKERHPGGGGHSEGVQTSLAKPVEAELETTSTNSDESEPGSEVLVEGSSASLLQGESEYGPQLQTCELADFMANRSLLEGKVETSRMEDFTDEAVLKSLRTLTECLVHHERNEQPPVALFLGRTYKREEQTSKEEEAFGQTRTLRSGGGPSVANTVLGHATLKELSAEASVFTEQTRGKKQHDEAETFRVSTPIEASTREPDTSRAGHTQRLSQWQEGAVTGELGWPGLVQGEGDEMAVMAEVDILNESAMQSKKQLMVAEAKLSGAQDDLKNLNIKIRLKEELIRDLVKNSRAVKQLNATYLSKIQKLEREAAGLQKELQRTQTTHQKQQGKAQEGEELQKRIEEHKKRLAATESRLAAIQKKQRETQRIMHLGMRSERRINDLESGVERLKNQQEILKRKLKKQSGKKLKLESELHKYQQRIQELQTRSDQQSKVLKVKTEEAAAAQRKLRQFSSRPSSQTSEISKSEVKKWLDGEMEKILQKKQAMEELEKDLVERERIVAEKETLTARRDALERRKLHSSQAAARDVVTLSLQIDSIENALSVKLKEGSKLPSKQDEVTRLTRERDELAQQMESLKEKIEASSLLSPGEETRLHELNEHIEVLEAAIEFKNDSIASKHLDVRQIVESGVTTELCQKFEQLSLRDARTLLARYFNKVVHLRVSESHQQHILKTLELQILGQQETIHRLERSLKQAQVEKERRLLFQQKDHQKQVQFLMQQLAEGEATSSGPLEQLEETRKVQALEAKVNSLEKDLYYYKKTSRDLRKKVKEKRADRSLQTSAEEGAVPAKVHYTICESEVKLTQDAAELVPPTSETRELSSVEGPNISGSVTIKDIQAPHRKADWMSDGKAPTHHGIVKKPKKQLRQLSASDIADRIAHKQSKGAKEKHKDE